MPSHKGIVKNDLAYGLWALGIFGLCGIHRFYLGKPVTGVLWVITFGLFFIGQFIDLFLIPDMVRQHNRGLRGRERDRWLNAENDPMVILRDDRRLTQDLETESQLHKLLNVAAENGKVLSLAQAIRLTGYSPKDVQALLTEAERLGLATVGNDPQTGAIRYFFDL